MARVTGYAFDGVTLAVAHVRNIHQRHGIVSQRDDPAACFPTASVPEDLPGELG